MNFSRIDPVIRAWASRNQLPLSTKDKNSEVRSFELAVRIARAQIWVEVNGGANVYVWDYRKRKQSFAAEAGTLAAALDQALQVARDWCDIE